MRVRVRLVGERGRGVYAESLPVRRDRKDTLEQKRKREHEQLAGSLVRLVRLNTEGPHQ